jgi:hypothetical protein
MQRTPLRAAADAERCTALAKHAAVASTSGAPIAAVRQEFRRGSAVLFQARLVTDDQLLCNAKLSPGEQWQWLTNDQAK